MKLITKVLAILSITVWARNVSAIPITGADIVTVDGVEWVQVDLFTNLSWNDINAVCPGGVCGSGTLNGYDVDGLVWASLADVYSLFNYYIGSNVLEIGGLPLYEELYSTWAPLFLTEWRPTISLSDPRREGVDGVVSTFYDASFADSATLMDLDDAYDLAIGSSFPTEVSGQTIGAWFYRASSGGGVPAPATLGLLGIALAGLGWSRRRET